VKRNPGRLSKKDSLQRIASGSGQRAHSRPLETEGKKTIFSVVSADCQPRNVYLYFPNSLSAGILGDLTLGSKWNELPKTSITANLVLCFRGQSHSAQYRISHGGAVLRRASDSSSAREGSCKT